MPTSLAPAAGPQRRSLARGRAVDRGRAGVTLIEMAIVLAIIGIMSAIAISMSSELGPRWRTRAAAKLFASQVNECRMTAIRTGRECRVWLVTADSDTANADTNAGEYWVAVGNKSRNSTAWDYLPVDDYDGSTGTDTDQSRGFADLGDKNNQFYRRQVGLLQWGTIGGPGTGNSDAIHFDARGQVMNPLSDFGGSADGYIRITFYNKLNWSKGGSEAWYVDIYPTGSSTTTGHSYKDSTGT